MSSDLSGQNPFKRGKAVILSNLVLEGKTNKEIIDYYVSMGFDKKYGVLSKDRIYSIRGGLKKVGLLNEAGLPIKKQVTPAIKSSVFPKTGDIKEVEKTMSPPISTEKKEGVLSITRRPDWDLLSNDQINKISDPELRMNILNYKTEIDKIKQELKPEFVTRGEIDQFRVELTTKFNELIKSMGENLDDEEYETDEEAINPSVISTENPLSEQETIEKPKSRTGESLIEVEKGVIVTKLVGFTTKSLMWYELDKTDGLLPNGEAFPGNLADYVNSCIEDVHISRNIGLSITQRRQVK